MTDKIRLHILGVPHTITREEYSHCAFTGKVLRFIPMMKSVGYEVYHYGNENSSVKADKNIDILSIDEMRLAKIDSYKEIYPSMGEEEIIKRVDNPLNNLFDITHIHSKLYKMFNEKLYINLIDNYRGSKTDIICLSFGAAHNDAIIKIRNKCVVETGIGYPDSFAPYRIFESYAILHQTLQKEKKAIQHYWFVCPNYYNILEFPLNLNPEPKVVGFFGRVCDGKGCNIIVDIAKRMPHIKFILCGLGDYKKYLQTDNIYYKNALHGNGRGEYLGSLCALIAPSSFCEPFCGVAVEAQLCGTPVITHEYGALVETVEQLKTGVHCHTLSDFCKGIDMAVNNKFDRKYIHDRAVKLYDLYNVAKKYDYSFKTIMDVHNGNGGWYSKTSYL